MIIIGAGLSGLIAANVLIRHKPKVLEAKAGLPNNHSAVLRFRTSVVGDATGIPFRKVNMIKTTVPWLNPVADALAYSFKTTKQFRSDRSVTKGELITEERYIAPPDLIARLASSADIIFNCSMTGNEFKYPSFDAELQYISTIPMPTLMTMLEYPRMDAIPFSYHSGKNLHAKINNCEAYVSLIVVEPALPFSRISITGDDLIVEGNDELRVDLHIPVVARLLGFNKDQFKEITIHRQAYAKISPIDDTERRRFMAWATDKFGIYSLGRFATWRPSLLLDDLIQDLRLIEGWMARDDRYDLQRKR